MLIGIVGKPNTGKSTFFKAATLAEVEIANYPFTTIKPNEGIGFVKVDCADKDFKVKCNPRTGYCLDGKRFIPVKLIDVAGLVPGAYEGKGMGNQFLDDLRQADILIHIIDVSGSTNEKGEVVKAFSYDPAYDIKFLEEELDMWYLGIIKKNWKKLSRQIMQERLNVEKTLGEQLSALKVNEEMVKEVIKDFNKNIDEWDDKDLKKVAIELRKRTKPMIIACNKIDVEGAAENFTRLENEFPDHYLIACSAESELSLREATKTRLIDYIPGENNFNIIGNLNEKQKNALDFINKKVLKKFGSTGVQEVLNNAIFNLLNMIIVFPVATNKLTDKDGNILPDCFIVTKNTTALDLAFKIHEDIGRSFIKAINVKTKQIIGKDHLLENRNIIEIMSGK